MNSVFGFTRFIVILGVIGSLILSALLFAASLFEAIRTVIHVVGAFGNEEALREATIGIIQLADDMLIAAAMYIIAAGLYELFIGKANLPAWLTVHTLDDLKDKLIGVSVAVLVVNVVEDVATAVSANDTLLTGLGVAVVILAVSAYKWVGHGGGHEKK
jgi:uncharacterized membrane protein YqhA